MVDRICTNYISPWHILHASKPIIFWIHSFEVQRSSKARKLLQRRKKITLTLDTLHCIALQHTVLLLKMGAMDSVTKAAKKVLKKNDDGSMSLKDLVKAVVKKLGDETTKDQVNDWINSCDKFSVDDKNVSLAKKKKSSKKRKASSEAGDGDDNGDDDKKKKKAAKKAKKKAAKKEAETTSSGAGGDVSLDGIKEWRTKHKIVLKDTADDEEGKKRSEELNKNEAYLPFSSFDSEKLKSSVDSVLLKQCTEVNGFKQPSAIQAQCWPVLLHKGSDGIRRDIVG